MIRPVLPALILPVLSAVPSRDDEPFGSNLSASGGGCDRADDAEAGADSAAGAVDPKSVNPGATPTSGVPSADLMLVVCGICCARRTESDVPGGKRSK